MKRYILMATDEFIADRFRTEFAQYENVKIHYGIFENIAERFDCLVSPANSFGIMDGGMDAAIINYFGDVTQRKIQKRIVSEYYGEQPVGTSFIIDTSDSKIPFLAHTPTMRIPKVINETDNVYNAMRATLIATEKHKAIETVAVPAFGYGTGRVHGADVAYQMAKAYSQIASKPTALDWDYAVAVDYAAEGGKR